MDNKLTAEIKRRGIPPLYAQETTSDPIVYLEINLFQFSWRWFVTECEIEDSGRDILFFGYVCGFEKELGYFRLSEMEDAGCPLLINYSFEPMPFSEVKKQYNL